MDFSCRDVIAAGELAVAIGAIVIGYPQSLSVRRNCTPWLPLCTGTELACRRDVEGSAPGCAMIGREDVEDVVVARGSCSRGRTHAGAAAIAEIRPYKIKVTGVVHRQ